MSWQQWQTGLPTGSAMPMVNSAPPVINPTQNVSAGMQYTPEQWQQMQQQNWQQWAQWQQQYQQWHQQYGAEYQKSLSAMAGASTNPVAPIANTGGFVNSSAPPPLPPEIKPPPPPDDPPASTTPKYYSTAPPVNQASNYNTNNQSWKNQNMSVPPPNMNNPPKQETPPSEFGNKRSFHNQGNFQENKRNKYDQEWQAKSRAPAPSTNQQPVNKAIANQTLEELTETEKKFMKQFSEWEAQFNKWKEQNEDHPDKEQYKQYEKKWETWRNQLLDRREQMRRRRLGLTGASNSPQPNSIQLKPTLFPTSTMSQNRPPPNEILGPTLNKPPPHLNNEPLQFKTNNNEANKSTVNQSVNDEVQVIENENTSNESNSFLMANTSGGIPGLDLVESSENKDDSNDNIKKQTDLEALSKNINSILGDQKLLSMLSMVTKNQKPLGVSNENLQKSEIGSNEMSRNSFVQEEDSRSKQSWNDIENNKQNIGQWGDNNYPLSINDNEYSQSQNYESVDKYNRFSGLSETDAGENFNNLHDFNKKQGKPFSWSSNRNFESSNTNFMANHLKDNENYRSNSNFRDTKHRELDANFRNLDDFNDYSRGQESNFRTSQANERDHEEKLKGPGDHLKGPEGNFRGPSNNFRSSEITFRGPVSNFREVDGNFRGPESTFKGPDDNFRRPEDNFRVPEGNFRGTEGNFREPEGNFRGPEANFRGPEGNFRGPEGTFRGPESNFRGPEGNFRGPEDNFRGPEGAFRGPDFNSRGPDSNFRGPDGNFRGADGSFRGPDGNFRGPGGNIRVPPDSNFRETDSNFRGPGSNFKGPNNNFRGLENTFRGPDDDFRGRDNSFRDTNSIYRGPDANFRESEANFRDSGVNFKGQDDMYGASENYNIREPKSNFNGPGGVLKGEQGNLRGSENFFRGQNSNLRLSEKDFPDPKNNFRNTDESFKNEEVFPKGPDVYRSRGNYQGTENLSGMDNRRPNKRPRSFGHESEINEDFQGSYNDKYVEMGYDDESSNWDKSNSGFGYDDHNWGNDDYPTEDPFPSDFDDANNPENEPKIASEAPILDDILTIEKVIHYDHKSKKPAIIEVTIDPPHSFDYRHKPVNRIPLPDRPKWLSNTFRNLPEFEPSLGRPLLPGYSRYPVIERFNYRSGPTHDRQDDYNKYNRRPQDEKVNRRFDDRKRYDKSPQRDFDFRKSQNLREQEYKNKRENNNKNINNNKFNSGNKGSLKPSNVFYSDDIFNPPGRFKRSSKVIIILRGPPGSGKTHLAKLMKDKEVENGGSAPRILSLDDYFMVEQEKEVVEDGKKIKIKEMVYEYEECMEQSYKTSLLKSFKKTVTDGYFPFIIVDDVNDKVKHFNEMWSFGRENGFQVYICQLEFDLQTCSKRNIHGRSEESVKKLISFWEETPNHFFKLDATNLLQAASIPEVEMEEINSPNDNFDEEQEEQACNSSKWDNFECSINNLAKLDGISKPLRPAGTMEDYLQLEEWTARASSKPGQKRVRWADLEECKQQEKMRAIGFVVGQTDWDRMMDPTQGSSALTQTKFIERVNRY